MEQKYGVLMPTIRDHLNSDIGEVWIDNKETYEKALAFVRDVMPTRAKTLRLYTGDRPLFNKFNLEAQIESIYQRKVTLPSLLTVALAVFMNRVDELLEGGL